MECMQRRRLGRFVAKTKDMFRDRADAGLRLAWELGRYKERGDAVVLAVPRGGMPVGAALARELELPFGAVFSHRVPHPDDPSRSLGAVSLDGLEPGAAGDAGADYLAAMSSRQQEELRRRYWAYRRVAPPPEVLDRTALLTDDEAATGRTLAAAARRLRREGAARVLVALPAASAEAAALLRGVADELLCLRVVPDEAEIPELYADFSRVSEEQALECLSRARPAGR